jgi:sugar/nucleoside kinase (ribokinase family)
MDRAGLVTPCAWRVPPSLEERTNATAVSEEDLGPTPHLALAPRRRAGELLVVTRGAEGADLIQSQVTTHVPAFHVEPVDPTGAGDVFAATWFVRLAEGAPPLEAARWAARQAACLVAAGGLHGLVPRAELARLV